MCRAVQCRTCGLTSWSGCGAHVEQVLAGVPADQRCAGHPGQGGLLRRLFRRG